MRHVSPATADRQPPSRPAPPPRPASPAPPPAAPGEERWAALALVNTRYQQQGRARDTIGTPDRARAWLDTHTGVPSPAGTHVGAAQMAALHALRDAIEALLRARIDGTVPPAGAVETVNAAVRAAPTVRALSFTASGAPHVQAIPAGGDAAARALAALAGDALDLLTGADAGALAACAAPDCVRLLVRTHGKRQWCSTRCGDRVRAARHYARTHQAGTG